MLREGRYATRSARARISPPDPRRFPRHPAPHARGSPLIGQIETERHSAHGRGRRNSTINDGRARPARITRPRHTRVQAPARRPCAGTRPVRSDREQTLAGCAGTARRNTDAAIQQPKRDRWQRRQRARTAGRSLPDSPSRGRSRTTSPLPTTSSTRSSGRPAPRRSGARAANRSSSRATSRSRRTGPSRPPTSSPTSTSAGTWAPTCANAASGSSSRAWSTRSPDGGTTAGTSPCPTTARPSATSSRTCSSTRRRRSTAPSGSTSAGTSAPKRQRASS